MTENEKIDELAFLINKLSEVVTSLGERLDILEEGISNAEQHGRKSSINNEAKGYPETS